MQIVAVLPTGVRSSTVLAIAEIIAVAASHSIVASGTTFEQTVGPQSVTPSTLALTEVTTTGSRKLILRSGSDGRYLPQRNLVIHNAGTEAHRLATSILTEDGWPGSVRIAVTALIPDTRDRGEVTVVSKSVVPGTGSLIEVTTSTSTSTLVPLTRTAWTATASENWPGNPASLAIDGSGSGTAWLSNGGAPPVFLTVDMVSAQTFDTISWLPRQDGFQDWPGTVEIYVGSDGITWGSAIATATWAGDYTLKTQSFASQTKRWIQFKITAIASGSRAYQSCSDLNIGTTTVVSRKLIIRTGSNGRHQPGFKTTTSIPATIIAVVSARITQEAIELLQVGGNPNARITQEAIELLYSPSGGNARVTQEVVETLFNTGTIPAAGALLTQEPLEYSTYGSPPVSQTQDVLEYSNWPPPPPIIGSQDVLEFVQWPPESLVSSQIVLEVALKGDYFFGAKITQEAVELLLAGFPCPECPETGTGGKNRMIYYLG